MSANRNSSLNPPEKFDTAHIALSCTFAVLIILLAIVGNTCVILAFKRFRRLRRVTNYFVVSLALTDILVAVISMPVWAAYIISGPSLFIQRQLIQIFWTSTDIMVSVASIWHLTFVSIDRYLCITGPLYYHTRMTSQRAILTLGAIWCYSIIVASLSPTFWESDLYTLMMVVLNYAIPVIIILIAYVNIFKTARYQGKQIELTINGKARRFSMSAEVKAAKTLGVVIGAFIVCWSPFFALNLNYYICHCPPPPLVVSVTKWMHFGNSMLNPLIYGVMNKDFRFAFKRLVTDHFKKSSGFKGRSMGTTADQNSHGSNEEEDKINLQKFSDDFRIGTATFTIVLILATVFGNGLVVVAFSRFARIRTVTNYFVVSLACSDLCVALFSIPVWVAYLLTGPLWVFGADLSRVWTMVDILIGTASIMNLMAISFDRVLSIMTTMRYSVIMTSRRAIFIICCVWIYSSCMATASFFLFAKRIFNLVATIMCFCVPLLVIISAYSIILKVALYHVKQIHATTPAQYPRSHCNFLRELKAAKTLGVVVGAFVVCWLPFVVINIIYSLCEQQHCLLVNPQVILVTKWMHYGNSMINPIIYTAMNNDFRKAFKTLIFASDATLEDEIP
ncbi:hypothetical protein pdam_00002130, partial [Pocillopora damicornis]